MAQMIMTSYGYMSKTEAWIISKIDKEVRDKQKANDQDARRPQCKCDLDPSRDNQNAQTNCTPKDGG